MKIIAAMAVLSLLACTKELETPMTPGQAAPETEGALKTFYTYATDNPPTEAVMDGLKVVWNKDAISILDGKGNCKFTTTASGTETAEFTGTAADASVYYAVCPYVSTSAVDSSGGLTYNANSVSNGTLTVYLTNQQSLAPGTFDANAHILLGKSENFSMGMKHLNGLLKFTLTSSDITEIELRGRNQEDLAGMAQVTFDTNGNPVLNGYGSMLNEKFIVARPASGTTFTPGTYYLSVPPMTFANGISLTFKNSAGKIADKVGKSSLTVKRATIINLGTLETDLLTWEEYEEITFLEYAREGNVTFPKKTALADIWPFTNNKLSDFPNSVSSTQCKQIRYEGKLKSGYSVFFFGTDYVTQPHPLQGFRIGQKSSSYFELPGKPGKTIFRVSFVSNSNQPSLTDLDGKTLPGGSAPSTKPGYNGQYDWYPKLGKGEGCRITTSSALALWRVRVYFTDREDYDPKVKTRILCIGNSFNRDAIQHVPQMMVNAGIDDIEMTFAYYPGRTMEAHSDWSHKDYTIYRADAGSATWGTISGSRAADLAEIGLEDICKSASWDIITFQEYSGNWHAWQWTDTEKGYFTTMFANVNACLTKPVTYYYLMTQAFYDMDLLTGLNATYKTWGQHETQAMFAAIAANGQKVMADFPAFKGIISTGAAIENLRTTSLMNSEWGLSRDGYHLDYGVSRCAAACTFFETVITPLRNKKLDNNGFTFTYSGTDYFHTPVTTENFPVCLQAARNAIAHPYEVTAMQ